jgi:hypothetical protein
MTSEMTKGEPGKTFEELKKTNEHGAEYRNARDLQPLFGYDQWRRRFAVLFGAMSTPAWACLHDLSAPDTQSKSVALRRLLSHAHALREHGTRHPAPGEGENRIPVGSNLFDMNDRKGEASLTRTRESRQRRSGGWI